MGQEKMLVRVKPYNKGRGHLVQSYTYQGKKFLTNKGWYAVTAALALKLEQLQQDEEDPMSPPVFDVCTPEKAREVEEAERRKRDRAEARHPNREPDVSGGARRRNVQGALAASETEGAADDETVETIEAGDTDFGKDDAPIKPEAPISPPRRGRPRKQASNPPPAGSKGTKASASNPPPAASASAPAPEPEAGSEGEDASVAGFTGDDLEGDFAG